MATPLQKFRAQYPDGTLTAKLISINEGQYVVRAAISQAGEEIATGLAASVDVQIAEDKARDRALAILNIFAEDAVDKDVLEEDALKKDISKKDISKENALKENALEEEVLKEEGLKEEISKKDVSKEDARLVEQTSDRIDTSEPDLEISSADAEDAEDAEEDLGPPIDAIREEPLPEPELKAPSASAIALESFNTSTAPVDLSDVIAQTDIELRRLGWNSTRGREYLEKTYGKRSRQQLTDEELMSFLLYLEEQS